jgi:aspartate-semialdehyde dehydrogenase
MEHIVALSHASGLASEAILEKLSESGITPDSLVLLDEESRVGSRHAFAGTYVKSVSQKDFDLTDCAILLMPESDSELEQKAISLGCLLVSHVISRDSPAILCGPQQQLKLSYSETALRLTGAELSCLLPALIELDRLSPIQQVNATLMRSAEFYGKQGVDELASQTVNLLNGRNVDSVAFSDQIAFNLLPESVDAQITSDLGGFLGNSSYSNQLQFINVPLFHGFVASIQLEFKSDVAIKDCIKRLSALDNMIVKSTSASPISDCNQSFSCVVSLLEQSPDHPSSLRFWVIADPMRYGLANNYVNVSDFLLKSFL